MYSRDDSGAADRFIRKAQHSNHPVSSVCVRPCLAWISLQWIMRTEERLHERPVHSTQDTSTVRRHSADPSQLRQTYSNFPPLQAQWGTFVHMTNLCAIITKITLL